MDSYFATIDELVHDQNKVVSIKFWVVGTVAW